MLFIYSLFFYFVGISINDEAVNYAFAGDHVAVVITGIDMAHVTIGRI